MKLPILRLPHSVGLPLPSYATEGSAGLDLLAQPAGLALVTFGRQGLPAGWEAYVGEQDALLHPEGVAQAIVGCRTVEGVGHDLRSFLLP